LTEVQIDNLVDELDADASGTIDYKAQSAQKWPNGGETRTMFHGHVSSSPYSTSGGWSSLD
jgi:hypothetical protein